MPKIISVSWRESWLRDVIPNYGLEVAMTLKDVKEIAHPADIVLFLGGGDVAPSIYGQVPVGTSAGLHGPSVRDKNEYAIMNHCIEKGVRMVGICRGAQLLCIGAGGELVQDVNGPGHYHGATIKGGRHIQVNSTHHQMMRPRGTVHELLAWSTPLSTKYVVDEKNTDPIDPATDFPLGEPEAIWFPIIRGLAIQWHPEHHTSSEYAKQAASFVREYILQEAA